MSAFLPILGTIAAQAASAVNITGGNINSLTSLSLGLGGSGGGNTLVIVNATSNGGAGGGLQFLRDGALSGFMGDTQAVIGSGSGLTTYSPGGPVYTYIAGTGFVSTLSSAGLDVLGAATATTYIKPGSFTVLTVPSAAAAGAGAMIYVSDETGGAVLAFSDGTNWKRVTDRTTIA